MFLNFERFSISLLKENVGYQEIHKMLVNIANKEDLDQIASSEVV